MEPGSFGGKAEGMYNWQETKLLLWASDDSDLDQCGNRWIEKKTQLWSKLRMQNEQC